MVAGNPWHSLACNCGTLFSTCHHIAFSSLNLKCLYMTFFLVRIPVIGFRVTLTQYDFMLTWLHLQWPYKIHFENGMNTYLGGQWVWTNMVLLLCNILWFISHLTSPLIHSWYYLGKRKRPLYLWTIPPYPLILWPASKPSSYSFIIPSILSCQNLKIELSKYVLVCTHCSHPL